MPFIHIEEKPEKANVYVRRSQEKDRKGINTVDTNSVDMPHYVVVACDNETVLDFGSLEHCVQACYDNAGNADMNPNDYFYVEV